MKYIYTTANGRLTVEFEADEQKAAWKQLAIFQEVFTETKCGVCGSENLRFVTRTVDKNDFYELHCIDCGAKLAFGQHKTGGTLFPKRKDEDDKLMPNNGWFKWNGEKSTATKGKKK